MFTFKKQILLIFIFQTFLFSLFAYEFKDAHLYERYSKKKLVKNINREINKNNFNPDLMLNLLEVAFRKEYYEVLKKKINILLKNNNLNTKFTRNLKLLELKTFIYTQKFKIAHDYIKILKEDFKTVNCDDNITLKIFDYYLKSTKDSTYVDSLNKINHNISSETNAYLKSLSFHFQIEFYIFHHKFEKALDLSNEALELFEGEYYKSLLGEFNFTYFKIYLKFINKEYKEARNNFSQLCKIFFENFPDDYTYLRKRFNQIFTPLEISADYDEIFEILNIFQEIIYNNKTITNHNKELINIDTSIIKAGLFMKIEERELALKQYFKALEHKYITKENKRIIYTGIAIIYDELERYNSALKYHFKALEELKKILHPEEVNFAISYNNIGYAYGNLKQYKKAIKFLNKSLKLKVQSNTYNSLGDIYYNMGKYNKSLRYHNKSLQFKDHSINNLSLYSYFYISTARTLLKLNQKPRALSLLLKAEKIAKKHNFKLRLKEIYEELSIYFASMKQFDKAYIYNKKYTSYQDSIYSLQKLEKIIKLEIKTKINVKQKEIELLKKETKIHALETKSQKIQNYWYITALILSLFSLIVIISRYRLKTKANNLLIKQRNEMKQLNREIIEQNHQIEIEKDKTNKLLLNILPDKVAEELIQNGVSKPEKFKNVSVYFSDIIGFTKMSSEIDLDTLTNELNDIFIVFDNIIKKNNCERIKTIGGSYLCVCGMHNPNTNHAHNILKSAIDIINYLNKRNKQNEIQWKIRIGLHTGPVVGGIVGITEYIYDVFDDTINTAYRIESNSKPMRINISEAIFNKLNDEFKFIPCEYIEVKNKNKIMMYFLDDSEFEKYI